MEVICSFETLAPLYTRERELISFLRTSITWPQCLKYFKTERFSLIWIIVQPAKNWGIKVRPRTSLIKNYYKMNFTVFLVLKQVNTILLTCDNPPPGLTRRFSSFLRPNIVPTIFTYVVLIIIHKVVQQTVDTQSCTIYALCDITTDYNGITHSHTIANGATQYYFM